MPLVNVLNKMFGKNRGSVKQILPADLSAVGMHSPVEADTEEGQDVVSASVDEVTNDKGRQMESYFDDSLVVGSTTIARKDAVAYIKSKCLVPLGEDFYYSYTYDDGQLNYIANKSSKHLNGFTSVFTPAFFTEGSFAYKSGPRFYMVTNKKGVLNWEMLMDEPSGPHTRVRDGIVTLPSRTPRTIDFKWSLHKTHVMTDAVLGGCLFLAILYYVISLNSFQAITEKAEDIKRQQTAQQTSKAKRADSTVPLATILTEMRTKVTPYQGQIRQLKVEKEGLVVELAFPSESYARMYLERHGGKYENGKVVVGFATPGRPSANGKGDPAPDAKKTAPAAPAGKTEKTTKS